MPPDVGKGYAFRNLAFHRRRGCASTESPRKSLFKSAHQAAAADGSQIEIWAT